ncbi:hypothetical protein BXO88_09325 [Oribacterium sp. C9]|nr:hypothetical protein BXO88_09325 [Oribacterium sp. C9]
MAGPMGDLPRVARLVSRLQATMQGMDAWACELKEQDARPVRPREHEVLSGRTGRADCTFNRVGRHPPCIVAPPIPQNRRKALFCQVESFRRNLDRGEKLING